MLVSAIPLPRAAFSCWVMAGVPMSSGARMAVICLSVLTVIPIVMVHSPSCLANLNLRMPLLRLHSAAPVSRLC
ncbi:hypothetical protein D9M70_639290 [compost metagenome]